jgi:predicted anti-sigma-YlaC factor YlaD
MSCEAWLEAISARADGEDPGVDDRLLDAHLARCADCRAFERSIRGSRRRALLGEATPMPDLSRRVSRLNAMADRASRWGVVRALLAVVALEVIAFAVPALVLGEGEANAHDARHLGAFSVAYGVSLLVVVVRPARARAMFPVAAFLACALSITAVIDLLNGTAPWNGEISHLPEILSVLLVWLMAVPAPGRRGGASGDRPAGSVLRVVSEGEAAADEGGHGERTA